MLYESISRLESGNATAIENGDEIDAITVKTKNGLLKKTVNHGLYANYGDDIEKEWLHFNGTYTAQYDKNGILKQTSAVYRIGSSGKQNRFSVKRKGGKVVQVIKYRWDAAAKKGKGAWRKEEKYEFTYTKTKISKARYASMINSQLREEYHNYYVYYWY